MKRFLSLVLLAALTRLHASEPGAIGFSSFTAPTRLGTPDGPLAGPGIWAQLLAGPILGELMPIGVSVEHSGQGLVWGGVVVAPNVPCSSVGYVQLVAWDGYWGTELTGVPQHQLGSTDIVREPFACLDIDPVKTPEFTQPAVVPPIPEPSTLALIGLGLGAWLLVLGQRMSPAFSPGREKAGLGFSREPLPGHGEETHAWGL